MCPIADSVHKQQEMSSVSQMQAPMGAATSSGGSELREVLIDKARELFSLCDIETKGFMTKR